MWTFNVSLKWSSQQKEYVHTIALLLQQRRKMRISPIYGANPHPETWQNPMLHISNLCVKSAQKVRILGVNFALVPLWIFCIGKIHEHTLRDFKHAWNKFETG